MSPAVAEELGHAEWQQGVVVLDVAQGSYRRHASCGRATSSWRSTARTSRPSPTCKTRDGQRRRRASRVSRDGMIVDHPVPLTAREAGRALRLARPDAAGRTPAAARRFGDVLGQDHLLGPDGPLGRMLAARQALLADPVGPAGLRQDHDRAAARRGDRPAFRAAVGRVLRRRRPAQGRSRRPASAASDGKGTLLFVDEIHRFNRAQQDGFLPYVEDGTVTLVGATTENPSFELNAALLSRCQVLVLRRLDDAALDALLERAEAALGQHAADRRAGRAGAVRHGRRRRPLPDHPGRAARRSCKEKGPLLAGAARRRCCRSARRSTTRRRKRTTT